MTFGSGQPGSSPQANSHGSAERSPAPFGRRAVTLTRRDTYGPYVVLSCHDPAGPSPAAGQFYMLAAGTRWGGGDGERPYLPRAFSVLDAEPHPQGVHLRFLFDDVGPGTHRLCELQVGEELLIVGPLGRGFTAPRDGRRAVLVGGGVGIAPLAIWQRQLASEASVLLGFRDGAHGAGAALLPGAVVATDDGSLGHHGFVTELLEAELERDGRLEVYACGPPPMLEAVRAMCAQRAVPGQLALESGMACGFGACFGCVVPTREGYVRLCVDGPVLDVAVLERVEAAGAASIGSSAGAELLKGEP